MGVEEGYDRLVIERLATRLGTTKGSFYWHFEDRAALLDAVLADWEQEATYRIIADIEAAPQADRVRQLFLTVLTVTDAVRRESRMFAAADHPQIGPVVNRVHLARISFLHGLLARTGMPERLAAARARALYSAYLGRLQLAAVPGLEHLTADLLVEGVLPLLGPRPAE
jgi:AcrR family transcriptional regulator